MVLFVNYATEGGCGVTKLFSASLTCLRFLHGGLGSSDQVKPELATKLKQQISSMGLQLIFLLRRNQKRAITLS